MSAWSILRREEEPRPGYCGRIGPFCAERPTRSGGKRDRGDTKEDLWGSLIDLELGGASSY
jgi:hypothetical protein